MDGFPDPLWSARPSVEILFRSSLSMLNQLLSVCHGYLQDGMHIVVKYTYIYILYLRVVCGSGNVQQDLCCHYGVGAQFCR
jgi:hypothetical protein